MAMTKNGFFRELSIAGGIFSNPDQAKMIPNPADRDFDGDSNSLK